MSYVVDTSSLASNLKGYETEVKSYLKTVLKKSAVVYGDRASRYVPPMVNGSWSKSIPAKLYKRKVLYLPEYAKSDDTNRKLFTDKLKQGYRFFVKGKIRGKNHMWFATTLRKAKEYTRIFNRGLFKFLFGANLGSIGEAVPGFFQRLLKKSPNLSKHVSEHQIKLKSEAKEESIKIQNNAWDNSAFARESIYRGERGAKQTIKKMWKDFEKETRVV